MLPTKFRFIWPNGFRGEESEKSANQKQEVPVVAMFVTNRDGMSNLAKRFQRKRFLEIAQSEVITASGGHVCRWIGMILALFIEDFP